MTTKKTVKKWSVMAIILALAMAAIQGVRTTLEDWLAEEQAVAQKADLCWFVEPRIQSVLARDLSMWLNHIGHEPDAQLSEWFDLRTIELLDMNNSKGVTLLEVTACLDSLALTITEADQ